VLPAAMEGCVARVDDLASWAARRYREPAV
jgi:hypothetical protein